MEGGKKMSIAGEEGWVEGCLEEHAHLHAGKSIKTPQAEKSRSNHISIFCRISQESSKSEEQETGARRSGGYCFFLFFLFVLVTRDI